MKAFIYLKNLCCVEFQKFEKKLKKRATIWFLQRVTKAKWLTSLNISHTRIAEEKAQSQFCANLSLGLNGGVGRKRWSSGMIEH